MEWDLAQRRPRAVSDSLGGAVWALAVEPAGGTDAGAARRTPRAILGDVLMSTYVRASGCAVKLLCDLDECMLAGCRDEREAAGDLEQASMGLMSGQHRSSILCA